MSKIKIKEFEEYCRDQLGLSEHSLKAYRQDLATFVKFTSKVGLVAHPSGLDVIAYQKDLREEQGASPSSVVDQRVPRNEFYRTSKPIVWPKNSTSAISSPLPMISPVDHLPDVVGNDKAVKNRLFIQSYRPAPNI